MFVFFSFIGLVYVDLCNLYLYYIGMMVDGRKYICEKRVKINNEVFIFLYLIVE